jgi:choline dehydrogenase-like flavoprotein
MFDFVIIGSGVSGGRMAFELTQGGARCLMLEAGREFSADTFPDNELDAADQMFWGGGIELSADGKLGFLRARCLGGTSVVNQALLNRFDDNAWQDWASRTGDKSLTGSTHEPYYAAVEKSIKHTKIPPHLYGKNANHFTAAMNRAGLGWEPVIRAQGDCKLENGSDCIVCLNGCPRNSKQSSLVTTIPAALAKGLEVRTEFSVDHLEIHKDHVRVLGMHLNEKTEVVARKAVLAAGALGNASILLRSGLKTRLPALGEGFTCHPQFMTFGLFREPVDAHKGAFQSVESNDKRLRSAGIKLENVFAGPVGISMLMPGYGLDHQTKMSRFRFYGSIEVAIRDEATGSLRLHKSGKIVIQKALTGQDKKKVRFGKKTVEELFKAAGAMDTIDCDQAFGLHLMGGCSLGTDASKSVVSPDFTVHGHKNLIVADSSVFPSAPGINPSFTIMALSARAADLQLRGSAGA